MILDQHLFEFIIFNQLRLLLFSHLLFSTYESSGLSTLYEIEYNRSDHTIIIPCVCIVIYDIIPKLYVFYVMYVH